MINKTLFHFIILFLFFVTNAIAQIGEYLSPLTCNPALLTKNRSLENARTYQKFYFAPDTLSLPFIDDFSSNTLPDYRSYAYPSSAISNYTFYKFKLNGNTIPDTFYYCKTQTYKEVGYDVTNKQKIRVATNPMGLDSFKYEGSKPPFTTPYTSFFVYPATYTVNFDTLTGARIDSVFNPCYTITNDTFNVMVINMNAKRANWLDNDVYLNNTFAIDPITVGVATFDGLDKTGKPYNNFINPDGWGIADYLTSKPINLVTTAGAADSIYFSFYYESQGNGNAPNAPQDSLVLEFKSPNSTTWDFIWKAEGQSLNSFQYVDIVIKAAKYLQNGVQFRFKNYATLSGSFDQWHIDYVYIDKNRRKNDKVIEDVGFINSTSSLLNGYSAVTYKEYIPSLMKTKMDNKINNLYNGQKNTFYQYEITDNDGTAIFTSNQGSINLDAGINGCSTFPSACQAFFNPTIDPTSAYPDLDICKYYTIKHIIGTSPDKNKYNDTLTYRQYIANYLAYDDGTAEKAYGVLGNDINPNPKFACKFTLTANDVLTGLRIHFLPQEKDVSNDYFKITIWKDANGKPGEILYQEPNAVAPIYADNVNFFHEYSIAPQSLTPGVFYIGLDQQTTTKLNVGFDVNTSNTDKLFYTVDGTNWYGSIYDGSPMIRAVFGTCPFETNTTNSLKKTNVSKNIFSIYPNPASSSFTIGNTESQPVEVIITNSIGETIRHLNNYTNEPIATDEIANGLYFIKIISRNNLETTIIKLQIIN